MRVRICCSRRPLADHYNTLPAMSFSGCHRQRIGVARASPLSAKLSSATSRSRELDVSDHSAYPQLCLAGKTSSAHLLLHLATTCR